MWSALHGYLSRPNIVMSTFPFAGYKYVSTHKFNCWNEAESNYYHLSKPVVPLRRVSMHASDVSKSLPEVYIIYCYEFVRKLRKV